MGNLEIPAQSGGEGHAKAKPCVRAALPNAEDGGEDEIPVVPYLGTRVPTPGNYQYNLGQVLIT